MMTDERIEDFFNPKNNISDDDYDELVNEYFRADKTDWYTEDGKKSKNWKPDKVKKFWKLLQIYISDKERENKELDFSSFHFPPITETDEFIQGLGIPTQPMYTNIFKHKNFENRVNFMSSKFLGSAVFFDVKFLKGVNFACTQFLENVSFCHIKFLYDTIFIETIFKKKTYFNDLQFNDSANTVFIELKRDEEIAPELEFHLVNFPKSVTFQRVDLTNTGFIHSDLSVAQFKECNWGNNSRIKLKDEQSDKKDIEHYKALESLYRQLKKNFEDNRDWELSGKAYVSEMEMRRKRFRIEKGFNSYMSYSIYSFYKTVGAYTQDFNRPFSLLIVTFVLFSFLYLFLSYSNLDCLFIKSNYGSSICENIFNLKGLPYSQCLKISASNTFLILKSNHSINWFFEAIQKIFSTILLTFFVLALRKRFKQ